MIPTRRVISPPTPVLEQNRKAAVPGRSLAELNTDVLFAIVSTLPQKDALALSYTARGLYHIAMRRVLASVTLESPRDVLRACPYMLADVPNRLGCVRTLEIKKGIIGKHIFGRYGRPKGRSYEVTRVLTLVTNILQGARTTLRTLKLEALSDYIELPGCVAIAAMDGLHTLEFQDFQYMGWTRLGFFRGSKMAGRLRTLVLHNIDWCQVEDVLEDIVAMDNLQTLEMKGVWDRFSEPWPEKSSCTQSLPSHPSLKTLRLSNCKGAHVSTLVRVFPNLREFTTSICSFVPDATDCWPALDHLCALDLSELADWPNNCQVHSLTVRETVSHKSSYKYLELLRRTSPVRLSMYMNTNKDCLSLGELERCVPRLRVLELSVIAEPEHLKVWLFDRLVPMLSLIGAPYLEIRLDIGSDTELSQRTAEEVECLRELPLQIARNIPSVRLFAVGFRHMYPRYGYYRPRWRFTPYSFNHWYIHNENEQRISKPVRPEISDYVHSQLCSYSDHHAVDFDRLKEFIVMT